GFSLAFTGAASATAPPDVASRDNSRQIFLGEEEIADVSLATFHVFDRESESHLREGVTLAAGGVCARGGGGRRGGGCGGGGEVGGGGGGLWLQRSCRRLRGPMRGRLRLPRMRRFPRLRRLRRWGLLVRYRLLGLRRLLWKLLAMGPISG